MKTKVSIVRCKTYETAEVERRVDQAFELLGGISSFVKKGERVLVKPNMLSARPPEHGVNTHIEVARGVVRLVKRCGAVPFIGDNPGGSVSPKHAYKSSGYLSIAEKEDVQLAEVKNVKLVNELPIASYFFECDKIISIPKMKTHGLTCLTGAVKNMFGAVSGLHKSQCHKRFPKHEHFAGVLVDVFEAVRPHLVLMDAIVAMDGDGPASGRLKSVGLLIASHDSVAVDSVFASLIGVDPLYILTTKEAYRRGLGEAVIDNIEIIGEGLRETLIEGFKLPHSRLVTRLPGPIVRTLASSVKFGPYINERLCEKCGICKESCPVSAITIDQKESVIDSSKCITCMCCNEVCPYQAVELRRNLLARIVGL